MRAARLLHISSTRTEDTLNSIFTNVAAGCYLNLKLPEVAPPPPIDELVIPLA